MASIQEVNKPEQNEVDPCSEAEKKTAPSQTLKIKVVAGQEENTAAAVQLVEGESWPNETETTSDEVKIQNLEKLSVSQSEEITNLRRQIVEAREALVKERVTTKEFSVKVQQHKKTVKDRAIKVRQLKQETRKHMKQKEAAIAEFSKTEEEKNKITEKLRFLNKDGCSINRTLKEEKCKNQKFTRTLAQAQKDAGELQNDAVQLQSAAFRLQNKIAALRSENAELKETNLKQQSEIQLSEAIIKKMSNGISSMAVEYEEKKAALQNEVSECKLSLKEYKLEFEEVTAKLEKKEKDNRSLLQRCRVMKAASYKKGKIVQVNKEKKAETREFIDILEEENEKLKNKLNTGFIGCYRTMKRFFVRIADALLFRTAH